MKNNNSLLVSLVIGISFIVGVAIFSNAFINRFQYKNTITVKGYASKKFTSDLIVWEAEFYAENPDIKTAFNELKKQKNIIEKFLKKFGLQDTEIIYSAVDVSKMYSYYTDEKGISHSKFSGYKLSQTLKIMSQKVDTVEKIARNITELLDKGVNIISYEPSYYYTKLNELKINMIAEATKNGKLRAQQIAQNSNAKLGKLIYAKLGVFQITGLYSNEEFTWGGVFNTSSKLKEATITITLKFQIK